MPIGEEWAIYVGGTLLVTAGHEEARANNTTPRALAEVWHHNLSTMMPRCPASVPPTMGR
ncbi:MAG: hypothetical protein FJX78_03425 [Armatimonadetes bacterium]|nr:hypothetical protein [Armatimonadota bacterium]